MLSLSLPLAAHGPPCGHSSGCPSFSSWAGFRELLLVPGAWPSWPRAGNGWRACWTKPRLAGLQWLDDFGTALLSCVPSLHPARGTGAEENVTPLPSHTLSLDRARGGIWPTGSLWCGGMSCTREMGKK